MDTLPFDPAREAYVSLATYRRDGRKVRTPVWIGQSGAHYYCFSAGQAGKVERIRANGRARLAACDLRGKIRGDWIDARARLIEDARLKEEVYAVLRRKYGWQMRLGDFFGRLSGRYQRRAVIELVL